MRLSEEQIGALNRQGFLVLPDLFSGAEVDALAGAEETLAVRRPHMIVEVHGYEVERRCLDILERYGYEPQIVNPRKWLKEHRPIANNRWLVCAGRDPNTA